MKSLRLVRRLAAVLFVFTGVLAGPASAAAPAGALGGEGTRQAVVELLDRMPLLFVPEPLSPGGATGYVVRGSTASVWLSDRGLAYRLRSANDVEATAAGWVVALDLVGAAPRAPVGEDLLPTKVSYFKGPKDHWRTGLPSYGSVRYRELWPGVDLAVSGTSGELKSTFVVRPGADPGLIRLAYRGASGVRLEPDGGLVVETPLGDIRELQPVAYQEVDGRRVEVAAAFELEPAVEHGWQAYRFRLGAYDPDRELIVDPVTLVYCGYIGGSDADFGNWIAVDAAGATYLTGSAYSTEATFPVTVGPDLTSNGSGDAFVAKVNASGTALEYCGYIGGWTSDIGYGVAVDSANNAYVTGATYSDDLPTTLGPDLTFNGVRDAFVAKVTAAGTGLVYCGYIGGSEPDGGYGVAVDSAGNAYVAGYTESNEPTFPVTVGPDLTHNGGSDAFVARVSASGSSLTYCGYIGGSLNDSGRSIAVDTAGNAYVAGSTDSTEATFPVTVGPDLTHNGDFDAFVAKVDSLGTALLYCGYVGGSNVERGRGVAVDAAGCAYVTGNTMSDEATFPVTVGPDLTYNGDYDAFVTKVTAAGSALAYGGYIGGAGEDWGCGISVNAAGNAYVTGLTASDEATFPVAVGPDLTFNGDYDAFVTRLNGGGTALDYCGYVGGSGYDGGYGIAVDAAGNAYLTGETSSTEATFPVAVGPDSTYNGGNSDAFLAKIPAFEIFFDGFESGDTSAWSATVP